MLLSHPTLLLRHIPIPMVLHPLNLLGMESPPLTLDAQKRLTISILDLLVQNTDHQLWSLHYFLILGDSDFPFRFLDDVLKGLQLMSVRNGRNRVELIPSFYPELFLHYYCSLPLITLKLDKNSTKMDVVESFSCTNTVADSCSGRALVHAGVGSPESCWTVDEADSVEGVGLLVLTNPGALVSVSIGSFRA